MRYTVTLPSATCAATALLRSGVGVAAGSASPLISPATAQ